MINSTLQCLSDKLFELNQISYCNIVGYFSLNASLPAWHAQFYNKAHVLIVTNMQLPKNAFYKYEITGLYFVWQAFKMSIHYQGHTYLSTISIALRQICKHYLKHNRLTYYVYRHKAYFASQNSKYVIHHA